MSPQSIAIRISCLKKRFGQVQVLNGLDLQAADNCIHGLIGLNGSGKTTTIECLLGLRSYEEGDISVLGTSPERIHTLDGKVAAVFDTPCIFPNLTVRQNLAYVQGFIQQPRRDLRKTLELLGLARYENYKARKLSFGNKRRLSIAQALLGNPELVIFDEPFNGLDAQGVEDVLAILREENHHSGTTFLLASHQFGYLEEICTDVSVLHNGHIELTGKLNMLLNSDQRTVLIRSRQIDEINSYISTKNQVERVGSIDGNTIRLELHDLSSAQLNTMLVNAGLEVEELMQQTNSLRDLFNGVVQQDEQGENDAA